MDRPSPRTLVVIQIDPAKSHRAVEALRIALGLGSHNEGQDITIILCGRAPYLLSDDTSDVIDADILEKHLPVFLEWGTLFFVATDAQMPQRYTADVVTKPITTAEISTTLESADRVLVFS
jgi:hypothetical protein